MPAPRRIADDTASTKGRRDELRDATIASVGQDAPVQLTEHLDLGTEVVGWIVAISGAARSRRDDLEITTTHEHLCITE